MLRMWQIIDICRDLNLVNWDELDEDGNRNTIDPLPHAATTIKKYLEKYGIEVAE